MQYYLGVDIGTTSAKAVAFSATGTVLTSFSMPYKMRHPQPGYCEHIADEVFIAITSTCNSVIEFMGGAPPRFISFSAAMHSIMAIDVLGTPLTNCMIWADNRAWEIAEALKHTAEGEGFYHNTGVPLHAMSPLCKLLWLQQHDPIIFNRAYKFIGIKEYVCHQFTGEYFVDTSIASATGLLNIHTLQWDNSILRYLDITPASLSQLVPPTFTIPFKTVASDGPCLNVPEGTLLIAGGSDGALANLGAGSADGKSLVVSIGTSGAARIVVNKVQTDSSMRTFCYHVKDSLYVVGGATNNGAVVIEWLKTTLLETPESFSALFLNAGKIAAGSDNLLFLPYILGERAPIWNSNARGVFFGLNINHTKSHLVRACMEGVIYGLFSIAKIILERTDVEVIHATGGFAQSPLWTQMLADVCGIKVCVSDAVEGSALGAVMIGREAIGEAPFLRKENGLSFYPDLAAHKIYQQNFQKFERIYRSLKEEWTTEKLPVEHMEYL